MNAGKKFINAALSATNSKNRGKDIFDQKKDIPGFLGLKKGHFYASFSTLGVHNI